VTVAPDIIISCSVWFSELDDDAAPSRPSRPLALVNIYEVENHCETDPNPDSNLDGKIADVDADADGAPSLLTASSLDADGPPTTITNRPERSRQTPLSITKRPELMKVNYRKILLFA
jgi:hypothetical protein